MTVGASQLPDSVTHDGETTRRLTEAENPFSNDDENNKNNANKRTNEDKHCDINVCFYYGNYMYILMNM